MGYRRRSLDSSLDALMPSLPAIAIDGAKGVGKSGTALRRASRAYLLDDPAQRELLASDPSLLNGDQGTVLLDEWQWLPEVWDVVRRRVDSGARPGRFLLTGSASESAAQGTHSGAGRIVSLRMRPMAVHERGVVEPTVSLAAMMDGEGDAKVTGMTDWTTSDYAEALSRSGFPGVMGAEARAGRVLLDSYLLRIIDRDLPEVGLKVRRPGVLRRWIAAYAAASSSTTAYAKIMDATTGGDGTQPAKTTTIAYREHLTQLWVLDPVPAWEPVRISLGRLQQAPKHQLVDPALALRALGMSAKTLMGPRGAHMAGPLFESLATLSVRASATAADAHVGHLRTRNGDRVVDLIVEGPDGRIVGIEVKLARSVDDHDVRHLLWLREKLGDDVADLVVLTTGPEAYRRADGVAVVPLALLGD
ncbi:ATP-binding protein [Brachybacterium sp. MASK1Z-5]|uniref:ATP-binding protein n=2 Tax=Brachybacterium halotolerans TaxID=2795215 RepID=A0ABS1BCU4_9MICO|nr:ATP-binding protein [Brachybacterium halotolerans]